MVESFQVAIEDISTPLAAAMHGVSWHPRPRCPGFAELALLRMNHWTFTDQLAEGQLVVARSVAEELARAFAALFTARFPIAQMRPICDFAGDDLASMNANNCSAFNFRTIAGSERLSQHALGVAVDINPVQNPWVRGTEVLPPAGADYLDREVVRPGQITRPGAVVQAFIDIGWSWGGDWPDTKDYHHFQKYPRHGI